MPKLRHYRNLIATKAVRLTKRALTLMLGAILIGCIGDPEAERWGFGRLEVWEELELKETAYLVELCYQARKNESDLHFRIMFPNVEYEWGKSTDQKFKIVESLDGFMFEFLEKETGALLAEREVHYTPGKLNGHFINESPGRPLSLLVGPKIKVKKNRHYRIRLHFPASGQTEEEYWSLILIGGTPVPVSL